jgi:hypothetical protein
VKRVVARIVLALALLPAVTLVGFGVYAVFRESLVLGAFFTGVLILGPAAIWALITLDES